MIIILFRKEYYIVDDIFAPAQNLLKDSPADPVDDDDIEENNDKENEKKRGSKLSRKHVTRSVKISNFKTDCTGSCKFNYYSITTTNVPLLNY